MSTGFLPSNQQTLSAAFANRILMIVNEQNQRHQFIVSGFNSKLQPQGVLYKPRPVQSVALRDLLHVYYQVRPQCWIPLVVLVTLDVVLGKSRVDTKLLPALDSSGVVDFVGVFEHLYHCLDSTRPRHTRRNLGRTVILSLNLSPLCHITTDADDVWLPQEINLTAVQSQLPAAGRYVNFFCNDDDRHEYHMFLSLLDKTRVSSEEEQLWSADSTGLFFFRLAPESVPPFDTETRVLCFIACPGLYGSLTANRALDHHAPLSSSSTVTITTKETLDASQQTDSQVSTDVGGSSDGLDDFQSYCVERGILLPPTKPEDSKVYQFYLLGKTVATNDQVLPSSSSSSSSSCKKECCNRATRTEQLETSTQTEIGESVDLETYTNMVGEENRTTRTEQLETSTQTELGESVDVKTYTNIVGEEHSKTVTAINNKVVVENQDLLSHFVQPSAPKSLIPLSEASFWKYQGHLFFTCSISLVPLFTPLISHQVILDSALESSLVLCVLSASPQPDKHQVHELRLGQLVAIDELRLLLCRDDSCDLWGDKVEIAPIDFGRFRLCLFCSSTSEKNDKQAVSSMDVEVKVNSQVNQTVSSIRTQAKKSLSRGLGDGAEKIVKKQKTEQKQQAEINSSVEKVSFGEVNEADNANPAYEVNEEAAGEEISFKEETMRLLSISFGKPFTVILKSNETSLSKKHRFLTEDGNFVEITGCEIDVDRHRLQKFQAIFQDEKFFIIEKDELISIRDFVVRYCRPTIRAIVCLCYQVRHNIWIPLLPLAVRQIMLGRIKLNVDLLPRVSETGSPLFLEMAERECNPGSDSAPIDMSNVLPSRRRRI